MTRPAQVHINLTALRNNFSLVRKLAPESRILSVVKADAYGHGLTRVAQALHESDAFGVACIEEAMELRNAGINAPILLLEGPYSYEELTLVAALELQMVIHHESQVKMLESFTSERELTVWLKVDTGMNRLGFEPDAATTIHKRLGSINNINSDMVLMSHLADAGNPGSEITQSQLSLFQKLTQDLPARRSIVNSAGILTQPESHYDFVRPGLMLYGISPVKGRVSYDLGLTPVMSLQSALIAIRQLSKGDSVGYGATWQAPETMPIGIVAIGYGDGYPRHAGSGTPVRVRGKQTQVVGSPSMDMIAVDLRNIPDVSIGDPVELWGENLAVEVVADHAGTIAYELVSGVHKRLNVVLYDKG